MAPFPESKIKLDYPLYGCDFDPQDSNRLFVGGGGGASKTGVGNKISILDTSSLETLTSAGEVALSRDEDNVQNLVTGQHKGKATLLYAGINSSPESQKNGKNEHFRTFSVEPPSKARSMLGPHVSEVSRTQLFTTKSPDTYQRLLRLSQPFPGAPQLGAVATGIASEAQIALFDVAADKDVAPKARGVLNIKKEAVDMDVIQTSEDKFELIYCTDYDVYSVDIPKTGNVKSEPKQIYTIPHDDSSGQRPALRCIRYLAPHFAVAVANLPKAAGIVLFGFRLPKPDKPDASTARIAVNAKLPKRQGAKATGLAVANLSPSGAPGTKQGDAQFVIAVVTSELAIHLYTLDYQVLREVDLLANLLPLRTLKGAHAAMITNMCFSHFTPPKSGTGRVQHLKLASTSVSNTCVVQSIPLKKHIDASTPVKRGGPPRQPRYVVAMKSRAPSMKGLLLFIAAVVVLLGILLQGVLEVKGLAEPVVAGHAWLPSSIHAVPAGVLPSHSGFLAKLLHEKAHVTARDNKNNIVVLDAGDDVEITAQHDELVHGAAKRWEDLNPEQKEAWKEKLKKGGHWSAEMGEKVFKSILFAEMAGVVGAIVGG
ncbi:hypothetical protein VP1G_01823 [Cytospora mali]|uniref:Guanine nucleotide-exchange factor SEC12 n=1 Tax=Cytospora mali TaxID=578113 RepID=A0A194URN6_CYTMA|nr:hypothetical protein VP1G_01823 [Valsa mali var. pyri (nom. inval.)]